MQWFSFKFVKQIILRNRSYVNMALNSRGRRMSEKIKMVIVQNLLMHLSVEAVSSKLKRQHFHNYMYMISRQGLYYLINSGNQGKASEEQKQRHTFVFIFKDKKIITLWFPGLWVGLSKCDCYLPRIHPTKVTVQI